MQCRLPFSWGRKRAKQPGRYVRARSDIKSALHQKVQSGRASTFAFVHLAEHATTRTASDVLEALITVVLHEIHIVLTDNGIQFADIPKNRNGPTARSLDRPFDRACWRHGIEHRLTKPKHLWTNGQVERMNRTIKEATVKRYHYDSHDQLRSHIGDSISAYNFAQRLKTLRGLTPYEYICAPGQKSPKNSGSIQSNKCWD